MLGYAGHDDARIKECLAMAGLGRMAAADGGGIGVNGLGFRVLGSNGFVFRV